MSSFFQALCLHMYSVRIFPGDITMENVLEVLPFPNTLEYIVVPGTVLLDILEHSVENYDTSNPNGAFLQISGML